MELKIITFSDISSLSRDKIGKINKHKIMEILCLEIKYKIKIM